MKKKHSTKMRPDSLVLKLILLVVITLVVFEGRLITTLFRHNIFQNEAQNTSVISSGEDSLLSLEEDAGTDSAQADASSDYIPSSLKNKETLAGLPFLSSQTASAAQISEEETQSQTLSTVADPESSSIVPYEKTAVDDSYFSDAVFIGDSRMQGFRNASGITQGTFFTSVGMSLSGLINQPVIQTPEGNITVAAAVSGGDYGKIYLMLGTNDLGEYDLDSFHDRFSSAVARLKELQPHAIVYICSIIYVEESKVTTGEYVNNTNVDKLNAVLLTICEEEGYYYLDLNEVLSNGYGSLIEGASSDGVHMYEKYCKQMLSYMKTHYIFEPVSDPETAPSSSSETEKEESDKEAVNASAGEASDAASEENL